MDKLKVAAKAISFAPKCELVEKDGVTKLYLYGSIVEEIPTNWWTGQLEEGDWITMDQVKEEFAKITGTEVEIHLNSRGGDVYTSVAIGNYIKDSDKHITMIVDAIAASGGSIIAMAGDRIKMYPNSLLMIHRAAASTYGNADALRKVADNLEKFDAAVQASYMEHFKGTTQELKAMIYNETYLTADECLTLGLCDEIIENDPEPTANHDTTPSVKNRLLEKYKIRKPQKSIVENFRR